jgi:hypothetical protein
VLQELYARHGGDHRTPTSEELVVAFEEIVKALPLAYIVLDALDECPGREELLELVKTMDFWNFETLHILV